MRNESISNEIETAVSLLAHVLRPLKPKDQNKALQVLIMAMRDARAKEGKGLGDLDSRLIEEFCAEAKINRYDE